VYAGGAAIAEVGQDGSVFELHCDHLGSPRRVTDGTPGSPALGQVVGEQAFGPYGESMVGTFNGKQFPGGHRPAAGWTGHLNEDPTGLIYMRGRYYSPLWHRFVSSDLGADPKSPNQYAYAGGSPFMAADPSGMDYWCLFATSYDYVEKGDGTITVLRVHPTMYFCVDLGRSGKAPDEPGGKGGGEPDAEVPTEKNVPCEVRYAIMDAVKASNSRNATDRIGGFHEEGGVWGIDPNSNTLISPAMPSTPWEKGDPQVLINVYDSSDSSIIPNMAIILGKYHVHSRGNKMTIFSQPPSKGDIANADPIINIVAGAENQWIYFYNNEGTINEMSFTDFMKGCPPR
jgi:RHS repeat-associated protein